MTLVRLGPTVPRVVWPVDEVGCSLGAVGCAVRTRVDRRPSHGTGRTGDVGEGLRSKGRLPEDAPWPGRRKDATGSVERGGPTAGEAGRDRVSLFLTLDRLVVDPRLVYLKRQTPPSLHSRASPLRF